MASKYTDRDLIDFNYVASDEVNARQQDKVNAESAVKNYGPFNYARQEDYDKAIDNILNRKDFTYDLNGDALYQQYKDNYITQGKLAMMDTMGQAAAMTGGYGNSYAASVGNQVYQSTLQNLNNIVPELYQLAMDRYNLEGEQLNTRYNLLATDRANAYSEYQEGYNKLVGERTYANEAYDTAYTQDYTQYSDKVSSNNTNFWNEWNAGYQQERDAEADRQYWANYDLQKRQVEAAELAASNTSKYEGWINPDDIEVDEDGNVTIDGKSLYNGGTTATGTATAQMGAEVSNFRTQKGDNFKITVNNKTYKVENEGRVTDENIIKVLNKTSTGKDAVLTYNGDTYVKQNGGYYKVGAREFLGQETKGYTNLTSNW